MFKNSRVDINAVTLQTLELSINDHEKLYRKLSQGFGKDSLRELISQLKAFRHHKYMITFIDKMGFSLWWNFDNIVFIEYLLIEERFRHQGVPLLIRLKKKGKL